MENKRYREKEKLELVEKNISKIKDKFSHFINAYIKANQEYSALRCFTMFSRHGSTGITEAINSGWSSMLTKHYLFPRATLKYLKDLTTNNNLSGNYHSGSFKTYLLAYYDYVSQLNSEMNLRDFNVSDHMQGYVKNLEKNNVKIKNQYIQTFKADENVITNINNNRIIRAII